MWNEVGNTLKPSTRIYKPEKTIEMDFLNQLEVPKPRVRLNDYIHIGHNEHSCPSMTRCGVAAVRKCRKTLPGPLTPIHSLPETGVYVPTGSISSGAPLPFPPSLILPSLTLSRSFLNKCLYPTLCLSLSPCEPASPHSNCLMPLFSGSCSQTQTYNRADAHIAPFIFAQEGDRKPMRARERFVLIACMMHH